MQCGGTLRARLQKKVGQLLVCPQTGQVPPSTHMDGKRVNQALGDFPPAPALESHSCNNLFLY